MRFLPALLFSLALAAAEPLLIVADEFPAMEVLGGKLRAGGFESRIVAQDAMPAALSAHPAVIVYIHRQIGEPVEKAFIDYANGGGKLILLHHSISSGKRQNRFWFPFLKIELPQRPFEQGGYKYYEGVPLEIVNLAPRDSVTRGIPPFRLEQTEVYLNHELKGERTLLLGLKYNDAKTGRTYDQNTAGWYMKAGRGLVMYFMPGHSARDFENPAYARILLNAVAFRP